LFIIYIPSAFVKRLEHFAKPCVELQRIDLE